ncbi:MAG: DivIVA domain-containing protein [Firmicutes bacterium]|jgi:cell division initiation protein|nr:DivIVA domain-containing protein [Bacillota bacterium]MDD4337075.1 DivIVA domain-containing protein [Bacillota bacterium]MDD4792442.1 DivIVA domain-containing protein [Bacillota bacterium]
MLTPLEVHSKQFQMRFGRYNAAEVDDFLDLVGQCYDQLYRENAELKENLRLLSEKAQHAPEEYDGDIAETIKQTLFMAQKAAEDARRNAEEKATLIVENAEREAAAVLDRAEEKVRSQQKRLEDLHAQETSARARFKAMLEAYLEMLEDTDRNA